LLYPFASIAALFFVVKYAAGMLVTLDHPVTFDSIYTLVFDPVKSYMPLLWFVHALFIIFAVYAPARLCLNNLTILLSVLAVNTIVGSDYPVFGKALANMPFFVFGVMLRENPTISRAAMGTGWRSSAIPLVLFVAAYLIAPISAGTAALRYPVQIFLGASGSLFVISASHAFTEQTHKKAAAAAMQLGYYSMTIYLLHTMFESTLRIGFLQVFKTVQLPFELVACIAIACGLVFPLLLEKNVLRKNSLARKFILGLP
jgi:hypothetical protein